MLASQSGCIAVGSECVPPSRYTVIVDACLSPRIAEHIAHELKDKIVEVIAIIESKMRYWKDQKIGRKLLKLLAEQAGQIFIVITTDAHFRRSARLKNECRRVRIITVDKQVRASDVWGSVGAKIVGDVKNMLNQLEVVV